VDTRRLAAGSQRFYARYTDPQGRRAAVAPPRGAKRWPDWGQAFTAACAAQDRAERSSYQSRDGEKILFKDLVADHYLPSIRDAAPNTRKNTASHLGDGTGIAVRNGPYAERGARTQLLFAFGKRPIGGLGPNEVRQWITQMSVDGYNHSTIRAKRSLLKDDPAACRRPGLARAEPGRTRSAAQAGRASRRRSGDHPGGVGPDPRAALR